MEVKRMFDLDLVKSKIKEVDNYLKESLEYWKAYNYFHYQNCKVLKVTNKRSKAWMFVREPEGDDNHVHLSRFVVENKREGMGSKCIDWLKDNYESISAWSKPDNFSFYSKNNFEIQDDSKDSEGYYYCVWSKDNL